MSEYVGGGDLSLHLRKGGMPVAQLREYTQQLVEALCYLHSRAVVHKDLRVSESERCLFINSLHIRFEIVNFPDIPVALDSLLPFHLQLSSCRLDSDGNIRLADYSVGKR